MKDYIYRNHTDSYRFYIAPRREVRGYDGMIVKNGWSCDVWSREDGYLQNYTLELSGIRSFATKREAKAWAEWQFGPLTLINHVRTVDEGW